MATDTSPPRRSTSPRPPFPSKLAVVDGWWTVVANHQKGAEGPFHEVGALLPRADPGDVPRRLAGVKGPGLVHAQGLSVVCAFGILNACADGPPSGSGWAAAAADAAGAVSRGFPMDSVGAPAKRAGTAIPSLPGFCQSRRRPPCTPFHRRRGNRCRALPCRLAPASRVASPCPGRAGRHRSATAMASHAPLGTLDDCGWRAADCNACNHDPVAGPRC